MLYIRFTMECSVIIIIILIMVIIYVLCCPSNKVVIIVMCSQLIALVFCLYMAKGKTMFESFYNPTKTLEEDKYNIETVQNYEDLVQELKRLDYNVASGNYDNSIEQDDYSIIREEESVEDIIQSILNENREDVTADYGISSLGGHNAKRAKQSMDIRSRFNSENFKIWHEEELDEAADRRWFDRDALEFDF